MGVPLAMRLLAQLWTQQLFTHLSLISIFVATVEDLGQASPRTTMSSRTSMDLLLMNCRSSYTTCASSLFGALNLYHWSHRCTMLTLLPIEGDYTTRQWWKGNLQLQQHPLLHHRLRFQQHHLIQISSSCTQTWKI